MSFFLFSASGCNKILQRSPKCVGFKIFEQVANFQTSGIFGYLQQKKSTKSRFLWEKGGLFVADLGQELLRFQEERRIAAMVKLAERDRQDRQAGKDLG